ncbi:acyltransferase ctase cot cpt [Ceraceosorus bombacis]|uniref:Acyltransferase ctase cot cpt n=1 Tax=Ceraceosorus bombacis TaxID=401625 RepID=A0A0N7LAE4_9BASI|nr:acyltransferase ctase cot cpt [Ceraceosorus bombacis]
MSPSATQPVEQSPAAPPTAQRPSAQDAPGGSASQSGKRATKNTQISVIAGLGRGEQEAKDGGKTFEKQVDLPKLPFPKLEDTCKRYLDSLEALQSKEEHEQTTRVVHGFLSNEGPKLHSELQRYASARPSYIEEFWDESYLTASESVVLNLNPFFILEDDPTPSRGNQLMRAASLTLASLCFIHDLRHGVLEPDNVRGTPLCMSQYPKLFGTTRIPTENGCRLEHSPESRHVVVMRRGQIYWFEALDEDHRPLLTERALLSNLRAICKDADQTAPRDVAKGALGILTTEKRKTWAGVRGILKEHPHNAKCLEVVDSALFVVCMDDSEPQDPAQLCSNMLSGTIQLDEGVQVGTCSNRWYDKLQIIVCKNGAAGINFEHSAADGHTVLRFVADIYTELIMRFAKSINSATKSLFQAKTSPHAKGAGGVGKAADKQKDLAVETDTAPKKLEWNLSPPVSAAIRFGETRLSDLIHQHDVQVLEFNDWGKNFITRHKFSPDAFVQMSFQAAYYKLYGRSETTYEPAMTKAFFHGRTEAIRTVQPYTADFVTAFDDSSVKNKAKLEKLRTACAGHAKLSKNCAMGLGHDRHLYAMNCLVKNLVAQGSAEFNSIPAIFQDAGYATLGHTIISTSNCGNPALRLFGFGPVAPDGFGLGYIIKDDAISICASSKFLQTARFMQEIAAYLKQIESIIMEAYREANVHTTSTYIDHQGRECDVRTGLPIGSNQNKGNGYADDDYDQPGTGYSFYEEQSTKPNQDDADGVKSPRSRLAGVGRRLLDVA